jgi:hypothetical protein
MLETFEADDESTHAGQPCFALTAKGQRVVAGWWFDEWPDEAWYAPYEDSDDDPA